MISLVDVIFKNAKSDQEEAWRQIDEGKLIIRILQILTLIKS